MNAARPARVDWPSAGLGGDAGRGFTVRPRWDLAAAG